MRKLSLMIAFISLCAISFAQSVGVCTSINNVDAAVAAGADYIEESVQRFIIPESSDELFAANLERIKSLPIPILACNGFMPASILIVGEQADHKRAVEYSTVVLSRADKANIRTLVFGSGRSRGVPEGFSRDRAKEQLVDFFKAIAPIAERYNIVVVIEPLQRAECNMINTLSDGVALVKEVGHPNFMCLGDIYHMLAERESARAIIDNAPYMKHFHVAELQQRAAPGTYGENLSEYYNAIAQIGYKGGLSLECRWIDFDKQIAAAIGGVKRDYLKKR